MNAAGNMTNDGLGNTYTYDAEGRVIAVGGNNSSASYVYDAMGQRAQTTVNGTSYDFIFEGGRAVDEVTASNWIWGDAGECTGLCASNATAPIYNSPNSGYSGSSGGSSWGWNFTKAFFGGLVSSAGWKAVYHSFGEGGCDQLMFETFAEGFNPLPGEGPDAGTALEVGPKAVAAVGRSGAIAYSISKGLSVPLRSSVYRGLQSSTYGYASAFEEAAPYLQVGYATGSALYSAGSAAYNGECH